MEKESKSKNRNIHGKPEISSGHDIAVTSTQWLGAMVFYLANLAQTPMNELRSKKYARRNFWVGYLVRLLLLALLLFLIWHYYPGFDI